MPIHHLQVIADDLSGAAECAAALAQAARCPAPLVLKGPLPHAGNWVVDSDTRAMDAQAAAVLVAAIVREAARTHASGDLLFKKIDSTLRGHVAEELRAVLAVPEAVQAAVVCNALPTQGRVLKEGMLYVHGQVRLDAVGKPLELPKMLAAADGQPLLLRPAKNQTAPGLARELLSAVERGTRVIAVDAADAEDLSRLALAIIIASRNARLLAVGAAGLCKALATELLHPGCPDHPMLAPSTAHVPVVAVIGSFSPVSRQQVDELEAQEGMHLVRLEASDWMGDRAALVPAIERAQAHAERGEAVVLAVTGGVPGEWSRDLVRRIAACAHPLVHGAGTLVLTGGDTARAVLDPLGIERLEVLGELEPGICLSRHGSRFVVTKAGGFGDSQSLARVLRHLCAPAAGALAAERKP